MSGVQAETVAAVYDRRNQEPGAHRAPLQATSTLLEDLEDRALAMARSRTGE